MKNKILMCVAALTVLFACSPPTPPKSNAVAPIGQDTIKPITSEIPLDSIPVIDVQDDPLAFVEIYTDQLSIGDKVFNFDKEGPTQSIELRMKDGLISYLKVNGELRVGLPEAGSEEASAPGILLNDGRVQVIEGANLSYLARYYGTTVDNLLRCNDIKRPDHLQAGIILRLNCKCFTCQ